MRIEYSEKQATDARMRQSVAVQTEKEIVEKLEEKKPAETCRH